MRINTGCHASDDAERYYEQQKRRAVKIVVDKLTGDPADPLTKILRDMAGMKSPEIHADKGRKKGDIQHYER